MMNGDTLAQPVQTQEQGTQPGNPQLDGRTFRRATDPVSFSRRAPTFHVSKEVTSVQEARAEISSVGGIVTGVGARRETTWLETQCCRIPKRPLRRSRSQETSLYVVIGLFSAVDDQPHETVIFIKNRKHLFRNLRWATLRLRGVRYFFSLKSVKGFRLYKCLNTGAHKHLDLSEIGATDLKQFLAAYKARWVPERVNSEWAGWIHDCLNQSSTDVYSRDTYSLEFVLGWSASRISLAILTPVILSLAIGCWFNSRNWTDLATIQTAWGIASYIATAGGLVAALLAVVSGLSNG